MPFVLLEASSRTSSASSLDFAAFSTAPTVVIEGARFNQVVVNIGRRPEEFMAPFYAVEPRSWNPSIVTNFFIEGTTQRATVVLSRDAVGFTYFHLPSGLLEHRTVSLAEELAKGPPRNSWIVTTTGTFFGEAQEQGFVGELRSLVNSIETLQLPHRSPHVMRLAQQAARNKRSRPVNPEEWARRIAEDIADAND